MLGFEKRSNSDGLKFINSMKKTLRQQDRSCKMRLQLSLFPDADENVHLLVFIEVRGKKESNARPPCQACIMVSLCWF